MPIFDGTGPMGNGPMTGQGLGQAQGLAPMQPPVNPYRNEDLKAGPEPMTIDEYLRIAENPNEDEMKQVVKLHNAWSEYAAKRNAGKTSNGGV